MPIFQAKRWFRRRVSVGRDVAGAEDGFLLIEVIISALLVGLIVVGTFTGFGVATRATTDQRLHAQAALLAAESQEQLRSNAASAFVDAKNAFEYTYPRKIGGTTFKVTQKASFLNTSNEAAECKATETSRQDANKYRITSSVTWPQVSKRAPVVESGTVTPPTASALEIDVGNYKTPTAGVSGVTATVHYTPSEAGAASTLQGTTQGNGCVVFTAIPALAASVEIAEKSGLVTVSGLTKWPTKEVTLAPNYTTHYPVTLNEGGALKAEFNFKASGKYKHKINTTTGGLTGTPEREEEVTGDTFVAYNTNMEASPNFELGSTSGTNTGGIYTVARSIYQATAETPTEATKYPHGNLFPFPTGQAWKVWPGDCKSNEPSEVKSGLPEASEYVKPGVTSPPVKVATAYLQLNLYAKTKTTEAFEEAASFPVVITNTACKAITPNNESSFTEPKHEQKTTTSAIAKWGGHLEHPFLPFGEQRLCLAYNSGSTHRLYTTPIKLESEEIYTRNIILGAMTVNGKTYEESVKRSPSNTAETQKITVSTSSSTVTCP
jgi:Tfp pilus assembly protein PilV